MINETQRRFPTVAVLLISGQDLRPAHNPALPDVELLRKPFSRTQLMQALRQVVVNNGCGPVPQPLEHH